MKKSDPGYLRFGLVAICALYMGVKNIKSAFSLAPFSEWALINWMLFIVGVILVAVVIPCVWMSNKLFREKKAADEKAVAEAEAKKGNEYLYDDEEFKSAGTQAETPETETATE